MPELYVGLMSGTSLDAIDAVLADFSAAPRLIKSHHLSFPAPLRATLLALNQSGADELHRAAIAGNDLARLYADCVHGLLETAGVNTGAVAAAGCHGQTVRHNPGAGYTIQLVNGALLAELSSLRVVCDFRSRDIAAGGQGAPLVPAFHRAVFGSAQTNRVIVNIGGMANITWLPRSGEITGFDCGPGNVLLDSWIARHSGAPYDHAGQWAMRGKVSPDLLTMLLAHPFFALAPPKSTGRETFNEDWLRNALRGGETAEDVQATLLELTATSIASAIDRYCAGATEIYACGGGARNVALLKRLQTVLPRQKIDVTDKLGIAAECVEALAFAWLAKRAIEGEAGNVPSVTGARGSRVLGAIYPK
jgi:anhydro-N-acetylmuramic acid kinase